MCMFGFLNIACKQLQLHSIKVSMYAIWDLHGTVCPCVICTEFLKHMCLYKMITSALIQNAHVFCTDRSLEF